MFLGMFVAAFYLDQIVGLNISGEKGFAVGFYGWMYGKPLGAILGGILFRIKRNSPVWRIFLVLLLVGIAPFYIFHLSILGEVGRLYFFLFGE